ncbi:MAG: hypothetical protein ACFE9I_06605 [Candidatus Hermodarchaeota archaeon]
MLKLIINDFLELRLEDGKTNIYVNNRIFMKCKYILLNIPIDKIEDVNKINSIDEVTDKLKGSFEFIEDKNINIAPETLFWAHCSNLQAWYENNYNTCLIHSNLAFPLLKELVKAGDYRAARVFKEEVAKRFETKNLNLIQYLLYNKYLDYLKKEELDILLKEVKYNLSNIIYKQLNDLIKSVLNNYRKLNELIDLIVFFDLNYNQNLIFHVFRKLNKNLKSKFAHFLILHLNYKEFINYKIPYAKFFIYFEQLLDLIYNSCPEINNLLKIIDSGFLNGALSLDEKHSLGFSSYHRYI